MKHDESIRTRRTLSLKRFVPALVAITAACVAAAAVAAPARSAQIGFPVHVYAGSCNNFGTFGNVVSVFPTRLDAFAGIDEMHVNGPPGPYENMRQSIYYRLRVYSYNTGTWKVSPYKRVRNGIVLEPEEFVPGVGWVDASGDVASASDYMVNLLNPPEVGVSVGSGWQYVMVETYWEQPSYSTNMTSPLPWAGGWRTYDFLGYCRF